MTLSISRTQPAICAVFDYLADGGWHPYNKVLDAATHLQASEDPEGSLARGKTIAAARKAKGRPVSDNSKDALILLGAHEIAQNSISMAARNSKGRTARVEIENTDVPTASGGTRSVRSRIRIADHATLMDWREYRSALAYRPTGGQPSAAAIAAHKAAIAAGEKSVNPITASIAENTPSGIPESFMWRFAPLMPYRMAHFTTEVDLDIHDFSMALPAEWHTQDPHEGKCRVWVPLESDYSEDEIKDIIKDACEEQGRSAKSLKVEANPLLRRNVKDLPKWFLDYLIPHYLKIATGNLARKRRTSQQVLNISSDDLSGYVALWLMDAAAAYDPTKSNFGQYALKSMENRFSDLVRLLSGRRYASKIESDVRKAEEAIINDRIASYGAAGGGDGLDAAVTDAELADRLNTTVERARAMRSIRQRVADLRTPTSLDIPNENGESASAYALADDVDITDEYEQEEDYAFGTRLLMAATAPEANKTRRISGEAQPNVIGLATYILEHIHGMTRAEAADALSVEIKDVNAANTRVRSTLLTLRPENG